MFCVQKIVDTSCVIQYRKKILLILSHPAFSYLPKTTINIEKENVHSPFVA